MTRKAKGVYKTKPIKVKGPGEKMIETLSHIFEVTEADDWPIISRKKISQRVRR